MLPLAFQFTSPGPVLYDFGPFAIRWYGLLIATAVLIGVGVARWLAKQRQVDPELLSDLVLWMVLGAIPGARLYYVLFEWQQYADNPAQALAIWQGGIAIHGALIGGTLAALIFARIKRVSFWQLADLATPAVILGQAIGRWGNFFNSEAFGRPTDLPWKLYIPEKISVSGRNLFLRPAQFADVAYYHPTFLYESLWNLAVFGLLLFLFFRGIRGSLKLRLGAIACTYCLCYSLGRVWIEGLRMDSLMLGPLRIAQVVSLIGIALGGFGLAWLYGLKRPLPDVVPLQDNPPEAKI
jgi:phosphatidylglycerol---prolipoprotein diacylglyceryl transferase